MTHEETRQLEELEGDCKRLLDSEDEAGEVTHRFLIRAIMLIINVMLRRGVR